MRIIKSVSLMQEWSMKNRDKKRIGFVPTMGYLHEGHLSLVKQARRENGIVVLSIFVNPIQFGPKEDFEKYPRDFERDEKMAENGGVDLIFYPSRENMYPDGYKTYIEVEDLQDGLCGLSRPGHFKGVATVVAKLFNIVQPHNAYFGQKDAQQCVIIKQMARDLNIPARIKILKTFREKDGLAMSSRNSYLSPEERKAALVVPDTLREIKRDILSGARDTDKLFKKAGRIIKKEPLARLDYFSFTDEKTLKNLPRLSGNVLVSAAVWIGRTRLIDNFKIGIK